MQAPKEFWLVNEPEPSERWILSAKTAAGRQTRYKLSGPERKGERMSREREKRREDGEDEM